MHDNLYTMIWLDEKDNYDYEYQFNESIIKVKLII